jgi:hypothetical protein
MVPYAALLRTSITIKISLLYNLQQNIGKERWAELETQFCGSELDGSVTKKLHQLAQYDIDGDKALN